MNSFGPSVFCAVALQRLEKGDILLGLKIIMLDATSAKMLVIATFIYEDS